MIFSLGPETLQKLDELKAEMREESRASVIRLLIKRAHKQMRDGTGG